MKGASAAPQGGINLKKANLYKRRFFAVLLLIALGASAFSCGRREDVRAGAVLSAMLACEEGLPMGVIYFPEAGEGEKGYMTEALCATLYGEGVMPKEWELVSDFAIYLCAIEHPFELAVFRCNSWDGAEELAELCMRRLVVLRNYWRGSDYEAYTSGGRVVTLGHYVLMAISSDSEALISEARRVIG